MSDPSSLKKALLDKCLEFAAERIAHIELAMSSASDAANDETKSSAGDKHETGRAMAQLEQEKNARALQEARLLQQHLMKINPEQRTELAGTGSLVLTDQGNFYLSAAVGKIILSDISCYAVSIQSPIGAMLSGKKKDERFHFNGKNYLIYKVL